VDQVTANIDSANYDYVCAFCTQCSSGFRGLGESDIVLVSHSPKERTMGKKHLSKVERDHRSNQLNPQHPLYYQSRGTSPQIATVEAQHAAEVSTSPPEPEKARYLRPLFEK
jgi:hypothetical protein